MSSAVASPDVSIVVVSWNTRDLLSACLRSVVRPKASASTATTVTVSTEVLVVDNGSVDGTPESVRRDFPEILLLENEGNPGFARANNQAIQNSHGRYVLLLNPDTEVRPGAIDELVRFMDDHPHAGAAGPLILNPDGTLQQSCYRAPTIFREFWRMFHLDVIRRVSEYAMEKWPHDRAQAVDTVQGACLILRREALERVGLLDERFFIYSEEVDLCRRLGQDGWTIHWVPWARIVHHGGQSTRQVAEAMFLQLYRGKILYFRKHFGESAVRAYKLILLLAAAMRLTSVPLASLVRPSERGQHAVMAQHYRRLIQSLHGM
ncbi:MAG: glycosyltransferase family 2 protein [Chloroflexi bacterium]|nr:glycosyltransferase family 2 protein [Chloroflexota bacterium]